MIIRKLFKFEGAHIVRNCTTERCAKSIHGHSYVVEVLLTANNLDNGQMIVDFGLLKTTVKDIVDSFDHAYSFWYKETDEFKDAIRKFSERWIEMPCSPSAESYALMFLFIFDAIIKNTIFKNGESDVRMHSVKVHETETGYAEAFLEDLSWVKYQLQDIIFSNPIKKDWKDKEMWTKLLISEPFQNPEPLKQITK